MKTLADISSFEQLENSREVIVTNGILSMFRKSNDSEQEVDDSIPKIKECLVKIDRLSRFIESAQVLKKITGLNCGYGIKQQALQQLDFVVSGMQQTLNTIQPAPTYDKVKNTIKQLNEMDHIDIDKLSGSKLTDQERVELGLVYENSQELARYKQALKTKQNEINSIVKSYSRLSPVYSEGFRKIIQAGNNRKLSPEQVCQTVGQYKQQIDKRRSELYNLLQGIWDYQIKGSGGQTATGKDIWDKVEKGELDMETFFKPEVVTKIKEMENKNRMGGR